MKAMLNFLNGMFKKKYRVARNLWDHMPHGGQKWNIEVKSNVFSSWKLTGCSWSNFDHAIQDAKERNRGK